MRLIKMFGLAAVAAVAAMAFVGATSASAEFDTTLCLEPSSTLACPSGQLASHVHFEDKTGILLSDLLDIECDALFLGDVTTPGLLGKPLKISGAFSYVDCNNGCAVNQVSPSILIEVLKTGPGVADITGAGEVLVECLGGFIHCIYSGKGLVGEGSGAGHVTYKEAPVTKVSGAFCPDTSFLDSLYISLTPLYIRS